MRSRPTALAASLLLPLLAACAQTSDSTASLTGADAAGPAIGRALSPDRALATLPREAGAVVSVVERRGTGSLTQTITLAGDPGGRGDDRIEVSSRERGRDTPRPRVDEETIQAEMAEALPGVAMTISPRVVTTASGPVGIATGRGADGSGCLYAWSQTEARARGTTTTLLGLTIDRPPTADLGVRVRLCRRGVSEDRLIAYAEGLTLRDDVVARLAQPVGAKSVGRDALESAGYGGTVADVAPVVAPPIAAPPAARPVAAARPTHAPAVRQQARRSEPTPTADPAPAATVSAPIPLPSGG